MVRRTAGRRGVSSKMSTMKLSAKLSARVSNVAAFAAVIALGAAGDARCDPVADFFAGRQISLLIGTTAGGGYDLYARALARHMGRHIPGHPTLIAKNMPGAGGLAWPTTSTIARPTTAPRFATVQNGLPFEKLFQTLSPDGKNALFDATKFGWIGSITQTVFVTVTWHASSVKTLAGCDDEGSRARRQRDQLRQLRLGDAEQQPAGHEIQGGARLCRRRRGGPRRRERRGGGRGRQGLDHADLDPAAMDQGQARSTSWFKWG